MSNLDKVFERNRVTKQGIDAMITNYLKLERKLAEAQAEITRLKGEAESWEKVFDKTCQLLAEEKTALAEAVAKERERCAKVCERNIDAPVGTYVGGVMSNKLIEFKQMPLTEEEISETCDTWIIDSISIEEVIIIVRRTERAHGIGVEDE